MTSTPPVWKVVPAEIDSLMIWLPERLRPDWPALLPHGLYSWLRVASDDRASLLIRTPRVVGLFQLEPPSALEPYSGPVKERWVRSKEPAYEEGVALYRFAQDWAKAIRAAGFEFNTDSDVPMQKYVVPALTDIRRGNPEPKKATVYCQTFAP